MALHSLESLSELQEKVFDAKHHKVVVINCSVNYPNQQLRRHYLPQIEMLAEKYEDVFCYEIDCSKVQGANEELDIRSWPMAMFFKDGDKVGERSGYIYDPNTIDDLFRSLVPMAQEKIPSLKTLLEMKNPENIDEDTKFQQETKPEPVFVPEENAELEQEDKLDRDLALEEGVEPKQDVEPAEDSKPEQDCSPVQHVVDQNYATLEGGGEAVIPGPCKVCQLEYIATQLKSHDYPIVTLHKVDLHKLLNNTAHCKYCRFIIETCQKDPGFPGDVAAGDGNMDFNLTKTYGLSRLDLSVWLKNKLPGILFKARVLQKPLENTQPHAPVHFSGRFVADEVDFGLYRSWLHLCTTSHSAVCKEESMDAVQLGVRLIDISSRSVVVAPPHKAPYVALSYVWGKTQQLLLNSETMERLTSKDGLSDDHLDIPKSIIDAMRVTSWLGFSYLWIDTLCIIQDDPDDKSRQIAQMDRIYSCASITIVSTGPDANSGIPGLRQTSRSSNQAVCIFPEVQFVSGLPILSQVFSNSTWDRRGWTLQEKALSKRLLIFTELQTFWYCESALYTEDTNLETPPPLPNSSLKESILEYESYTPMTLRIYKPSIEDPAERRFGDYLRSYIRRELTNQSDVINAFAGVLKVLSPQLGEHICGFPRLQFDMTMGWQTDGHFPDRRQTEFPSWSWAGWKGGQDVEFSFGTVGYISRIWWWRIDNHGRFVLINTRGKDPVDSEFTSEFFGLGNSSPPPNPADIVWHDNEDLEHPLNPPRWHLLFFWTSAVTVSIGNEPIKGQGCYSEYPMYVHGHIRSICTVVLDEMWRRQKSQTQFECYGTTHAYEHVT